MRTYKIITLTLAAAMMLQSCNFSSKVVSRDQLDAVSAERDEAKKALKATQENYIKQNTEMTAILQELASLTKQTAALQLNVESGNAPLSQAEMIDESLDNLRKRIDDLEAQAAKVRSLDKQLAISVATIKELRSTVDTQQQEIVSLKKAIEEKDAAIQQKDETIVKQGNTITEQSATIQSKESELKKVLDKQTEMLFQAGRELEALGDVAEEVLSVSGKKNKTKVGSFKKSIYEKALVYYNEAAAQNHEGAIEQIFSLKQKIGEIE